jgi:hypothetical protein
MTFEGILGQKNLIKSCILWLILTRKRKLLLNEILNWAD